MRKLEVEYMPSLDEAPRTPVRPDDRRSKPAVVAQMGGGYLNTEAGAIEKPNGRCATLQPAKSPMSPEK
jgi:hypothetical protein